MKIRLGKRTVFLASLALACSCGATGTGGPTTTVYVGRHFEVRDHDEPVKYVLNGNTRVARITGPMAARPRLQRFRLYGGWNLLSLAVSASDVLGQITNGLPSILSSEAIFWWDRSTSAWLPLSRGQALPAGAVLWLYAGGKASLALTGTYMDPTNQGVSASGTLVPAAGLEAWDVGSGIANLPSASAWSYDSAIGDWLSWLPPPFSAQTDLPGVISPGSVVFVRTAVPAELKVPEPALQIRYYQPDHLGSASVTTDAEGAVVEEVAYYPFGATRNPFEPRGIAEAYGFNQKERDRESGLHYFEARYLHGAVAHFLTADPAYASPERLPDQRWRGLLQQPQLLNLYSYGLNSPLRFQDPTGLEPVKLNWVQTIAVVAAQQQAIAMLDDAIASVQRDLNACAPNNPADAMLEKWFGYNSGLAKKQQITANLQKVRNQLARLGPGNFMYDAVPTGDAAGAIAYVYPDDPNRVYLTDKFFALPSTGMDSKAGTLIHENSHPSAVLGTKDLVYGPDDAADLASKDNGKALRNADNYEYFNEGLQLEPEERMASDVAKYFNDLQAGRSSK